MDIPNLYRIIHYGIPAAIDEYVQETGRAGRDGKKSEAIIIYHQHALLGSVTECEMKDYVKITTCRRAYLLQAFDEIPVSAGSPNCCDNCASKFSCCSCPKETFCNHIGYQCFCVRSCGLYSVAHTYPKSIQTEPEAVTTALSPDHLAQLKAELQILRSATTASTLPTNIGNIYPELIDSIIENHIYFSSPQDILEVGALSIEDATSIYNLIQRFTCSI